MHPCLSIDEILRLIACELAASTGRATTVALACCCKSFEDPALDALWETQNTLLPLLKSLPGDVWDGDGYTVSVPTTCVFFFLNRLDRKSFRRLPTTLEWARFRNYVRRIRTFKGPGDSIFLSAEAFAVLQPCAVSEPFLPNLKCLYLWDTVGGFIPFIPSFLSPATTIIDIIFDEGGLPKATFASMVTTFPALCPNLQRIYLYPLPRDLIITAAVSKFLLTTNRRTLRQFRVDSPLTEEAREVIYKLPNLCGLWVAVEGPTSLPTMVLPNLTEMDIEYDHNCAWLEGFRGATFGRLDSIIFRPKSESTQIAGFLEAFESVGLTTSTTLSTFKFYTPRPWRPNYRSLLPFTQLRELEIEFSCDGGCSSTIDDDIITDMARVMPKLEILLLGTEPCQTATGVTAKGLAVLAYYCPNLSNLRIHLRVDSLSTLPAISGTPRVRTAAPRRDCALRGLHVGQIPMPKESVLMAALTLSRIFPHLIWINSTDDDKNWAEVSGAVSLSGEIHDRSSKKHSLATPRSNLSDTSPAATLESGD
jgi:hypothetical protein